MDFRRLLKPFLALGLIATLPLDASAEQQVRIRADLAQGTLVTGVTQKTYVKIALEGVKHKGDDRRAPVNVALVVDRSGSMRGEKLARAKDAAIMALKRLNSKDIGSVVVYDHEVDVLLPATPMSDAGKYADKIRRLKDRGQTALYAGVQGGVKELERFLDRERVNRVILLSDGMANVGPSSPAALGELGRKIAQKGISVTTIGLGLGYNEDLMTKLAFNSDGNHAFVESPNDLVKIFNQEFGDVLSVVAQEVEIEIIFRSGCKPLRSIGREARIKGNKVSYKLNQLYGAQEKEVVVELEVDGGKASNLSEIADVKVRYLNLATKQKDEVDEEVAVKFTKSTKEAEASIKKDVLVSVTSQIAVERNEKALLLRDKGKIKEARELLKNNAAYIRQQAQRVGGSSELSELETSNIDDESNIAAPNWNKTRKLMRAKQYKSKTKQSY